MNRKRSCRLPPSRQPCPQPQPLPRRQKKKSPRPPPAKRPRVGVPQTCKFQLNEGAAELQIYRGRVADAEPQFKMWCKSCNATCSRAVYKVSLGHLLMWGHLPCEGDMNKHNGWKMCNKMLPHHKRQDWLTWAESHLRDAWGEQQRLRLDDRQDEPMELKR